MALIWKHLCQGSSLAPRKTTLNNRQSLVPLRVSQERVSKNIWRLQQASHIFLICQVVLHKKKLSPHNLTFVLICPNLVFATIWILSQLCLILLHIQICPNWSYETLWVVKTWLVIFLSTEICSKLRKSVAYWGHCKSVSWQQTLKAVLPNWLEQRFLGLGELFLLDKQDFWAVSVGLFGLIFFLVGSCVAQPAADQILKKCGYYAGTFVPKMWGNVGLKHKKCVRTT